MKTNENDVTGNLAELAALVAFAASRVGEIDGEIEFELRKIKVALINIGREIDDIRCRKLHDN